MAPVDTENRINAALWRAKFATAIVGNVSTREFELINVDKLPLSEETVQKFNQRGFEFVGLIALHEDGPRTALTSDLDGETIRALCVRFLKQLERELNARVVKQVAKSIGDSLEWLKRLHTLPDRRNGMEN